MFQGYCLTCSAERDFETVYDDSGYVKCTTCGYECSIEDLDLDLDEEDEDLDDLDDEEEDEDA